MAMNLVLLIGLFGKMSHFSHVSILRNVILALGLIVFSLDSISDFGLLPVLHRP